MARDGRSTSIGWATGSGSSIDGPLHLTAEITAESLEALALRPGDPVHASVKATDIDAYPA